MEEVLIEKIAFWGIAGIACVLVALILISVLAIARRVSSGSNSPESERNEKIKIGKAIIRRIDHLDDLIASLREKSTDESVIRQLRFFRDDLIDLLRNHSIEAFDLENGTVLDKPTRELIQVVESTENRAGSRIVETVRHGYRHRVSLNQPSTIVRKPLVRVR